MTTYWHYTTGDCLADILADGEIMPATGGIPVHEKPMVWFSANPQWEPTATKGVIEPSGWRRDSTLAEMMHNCGGLYRIAVNKSLTPWPRVGAQAGIGKPLRQALEMAARAASANPDDWAGFIGAIPATAIEMIEKLDESGRWVAE